jgi:hypothetical protein
VIGVVVFVVGLVVVSLGLWLFGFTVQTACGVSVVVAGVVLAWAGLRGDWERGDGEPDRARP